MLEVEDVHTFYGPSHVLHGVSLHVPRHSVVALLGRNGVGKTTLIRSIAGVTPARQGRILFEGRDITRLPTHRIARSGVGLIPQGRRLFDTLTVRETLQIASRRSPTGAPWTVERVLDRFPRLRERLASVGTTLSGGEQQMLATARALVGNPKLLLMDEPAEGLAPLVAEELGAVIRDLRSEGLSILLVEQHMAFALGLADSVYVMTKGSIVYYGIPGDLWQNEAVRTQYLGV